jgi:hypothetical protein
MYCLELRDPYLACGHVAFLISAFKLDIMYFIDCNRAFHV